MIADEMDNMWGVVLVHQLGRVPVKDTSVMQLAVTEAIPGFYLHSLEISGTAANKIAVEQATNFKWENCLFAQGSYIGGCCITQRYSTTNYTAAGMLSLPSEPHMVESADYRQQIVALPYIVPCDGFNEQDFRAYEWDCLNCLNRKLLRARISGRPYTAILLELLLGGCGGELRPEFLKHLGLLLFDHNVQIIADEIMTGGRVGPQIAVTSTTPIEFRQQVAFITMGKMTNCGMVLERAATRPVEQTSYRGYSTNMAAGEAWQAFTKVHQRIQVGMIESRRTQVLAKMNAGDESWGRGCLIFTNWCRSFIQKGLKNRLLPMLEDTKVMKGPSRPSPWTRRSVCTALMESGKTWMAEMEKGDKLRQPFVFCLAGYMLDTRVVNMTADGMLAHIGEETADEFAERERNLRLEKSHPRSGHCTKSAKSFLDEVLGTASVNVDDFVQKVRVTKKRKLAYRVDRDQLVEVADFTP